MSSDKTETPPLDADKRRTPRGKTISKIDVYGWVIEDKPGQFREISKRLLNIDHEYQRDKIQWKRVDRIASRWSWAKFITLAVAQRPDGTYWVFEGQHRKLAADKRSDIDDLPCMVFQSTGPTDESRLFLGINDDRGPVHMIDRFKALFAQNDETARAVEQMVGADGYRIARGGSEFTVQCVGIIYRLTSQNPAAAQQAWSACVEVYAGQPIADRVFSGFYEVQRQLTRQNLGLLTDSRWRPIVRQLSHSAIIRSIVVAVEFHGKGGPKAFGEGIIRLMNKRRRSNLIPTLYAESTDRDEQRSEQLPD